MKRLVCMLLALALLLAAMPVTVMAAETESGSCGETVNWTLSEDGTMTISGTGEMEEYYSWTIPWKERLADIKTVVVEEGVTILSSYAFAGCKNLTTVTLPDSLTTVGKYAFRGCTGLTDVELGGTADIGMYSFSDCTALTSIIIPATVETITQSAFAYCTNLANVTFEEAAEEEGVMTVGGYADGLRISSYAFRDCMGLTNVYLPRHLVSVGGEAFIGCRNLQGIWAETYQTLDGVQGPKYLTDSRGVLYEYDYDFEEKVYYAYMLSCVPAQLTGAYTIKPTVRSIDGSFYGCSKLTSLTFTKDAGGINDLYGFMGCTSLETVTAGAGNEDGWYNDASGALLQRSGDRVVLAFVPVNNTDYTVAKDVTFLYDCAFTGGSLKRIQVENGSNHYSSKAGVLYSADGSELVAYPAAAAAADFFVPETVGELAGYAFAYARNLKDVWFTDTVVWAGSDTFFGTSVTCHYPGNNEEWKMLVLESGLSSNGNITWVPYDKLPEETSLEAPQIKIGGVAASGKPKISWAKVDGAVKYEVYRSKTGKAGSFGRITRVTGTSLINKSAAAGTRYYYKVRAVDADGNKSEFSNVVSRVCDLPQPVVKTSNDAASGKVKLTWNEIEGAKSYKIYRATSKTGKYSLMKTVTGTSYINNTSKAGKTYYYKVVAVHENSNANSAYSAIVSRMCDLARPTITVKRNSSGKPRISWEKVDGAVKYEVWRATSKNGKYTKLITTKNLYQVNKNAKAGVTYYYKVKAIYSNTNANSAFSLPKYCKAK